MVEPTPNTGLPFPRTMKNNTFQRDRLTWLAYLMLAFYGYFLNILGPLTPFLKSELNLSYTLSSLHFTAFAVGILLIGLAGHVLIERIGRRLALWLGAFGMSTGAFVLLAGRSVLVTISACFCMGVIGSLILVIVSSALSDRHGELRSVALSEANVIASLVATAAPLLVGAAAHLPGGWRLALGAVAFAPFLMLPGFGRVPFPLPASRLQDAPSARQPLPKAFWVFWLAVFMAVSVEFSMIFWSADYLETGLGMLKGNAARSVSLFLAAMIAGRLAASRLVEHFSARRVVMVSTLVAGAGFALFWTARTPLPGLVGLFVTGLGVAGLYPLLLSLSIGAAPNQTVRASGRTTLASGCAILLLPLVLGRLADLAGIRLAYGVVGILLAGIFLIMLVAGGMSHEIRPSPLRGAGGANFQKPGV
jgi:fucose permease